MKFVQAVLDGHAHEVVFPDHLVTDFVDIDDGVGVCSDLFEEEEIKWLLH